MASRYLLDTNILSELIRRPARLASKIRAVGQANVCTSVVVACELRFGARKKGSDALTLRVEHLLSTLEVMPLEPGADRVYAEMREFLESRGRPIGGNDYLIAAHAVQRDCVLVTQNQREFRRVPKLSTQNWIGAR